MFISKRAWTLCQMPKNSLIFEDSPPEGVVCKYFPDMLNADNATKSFFREVGTAYLYRCNGPVVVEPFFGWAIIPGRRILNKSFIFSEDPWRSWPMPSLLDYISPRRNTIVLEKAVSLSCDWGNYYHFFVDVLPQFYVLDICGVPANIPVIVPHCFKNKRFIQDFMKLSGYLNRRPIIVQQRYEYIKVKKEIYFSKDSNFHSKGLHAVLDSFAGLIENESFGCRVFLNRSPETGRYITNFEELRSLIGKYGLRIVDSATMSLEDQIRLFSSTEILVGIHGAGLANMIFRRGRDMKIMEIFTQNRQPNHYKRLASDFNYDYTPFIAGAPLQGKSGFDVDPALFENALAQCLGS